MSFKKRKGSGPRKTKAENTSRSTRKNFPSLASSAAKRRPTREQYEELEFNELPVDKHIMQKSIALTEERIEEWLSAAKKLQETPYSPPASPLDELDPWQNQAVQALFAGKNVIVDAPTTAGKTRVIEAYFATHIHDPGFRACYTCPVKSLSNDKVKEFRVMFGSEYVGIATGDLKENLDAPIVVATLETYRNSLLGIEPDLGRRLVVFDEYHYLMDVGRGSAWEEAIILTPQTCQILMLSASISNANDFCEWLERIQTKPCTLIQVTHRPVPLTDLVYTGDHWIVPDLLPENAYRNLKKKAAIPLSHNRIAERLVAAEKLELTPGIIYCGKRLSCELLAETIAKHLPPLDEERSMKIGKMLQETHKENNALSFITPQVRKLIQGHGVAFHHSGLGPPARIAIENLLKKGLLRYCTATMGLSLGINFSVRSAMLTDYTRPGDNGITTYGPSEVLQMLGRAGRRGNDVVGFSLWPNLQSYAILGKPHREICSSKLKNDPTTFLGLVSRGYELVDIEKFYKKSFMHFKDSSVDLTIIDHHRLQKKLKATPPCTSPVGEYIAWKHGNEKTHCSDCKFKKVCHNFIVAKQQGALARLHVHLHKLDALDRYGKLTPFGEIAKYFPHDGGLIIAKMLAEKEITESNLHAVSQLFAAFSMARFKTPNTASAYRFPWRDENLEKKLEKFYPFDLFPELYDPPYGNRPYPIIKTFNPKGGYIVDAWLKGSNWSELINIVTTEKVAPGDISALIYRVASYFQSMSQMDLKEISAASTMIRDELVREPLSFKL